MPWELDQRLKCGIHEANMNLTNSQQCDWFIVVLLPHLRISFSQQKVGTQVEALEITMTLHDTAILDATFGVQQIHAKLKNLYLEFQSLKKEKAAWLEVNEEVWCLKCKNQGHDKDHYLVFTNYMAGGGLILLSLEAQAGLGTGPASWLHYLSSIWKTCSRQLPLTAKVCADTTIFFL